MPQISEWEFLPFRHKKAAFFSADSNGLSEKIQITEQDGKIRITVPRIFDSFSCRTASLRLARPALHFPKKQRRSAESAPPSLPPIPQPRQAFPACPPISHFSTQGPILWKKRRIFTDFAEAARGFWRERQADSAYRIGRFRLSTDFTFFHLKPDFVEKTP
ncbi:MAG TPA: hypothetical protein H9694_01475 [Firmicutes bacterium]|nr:hypothetical protein [Bacillota bacterium]